MFNPYYAGMMTPSKRKREEVSQSYLDMVQEEDEF
jgi:hypothetical protein